MTDPGPSFDESMLTPHAGRRIGGEDVVADQTWHNDGERLLWQAEQEGREIPSEAGARQ